MGRMTHIVALASLAAVLVIVVLAFVSLEAGRPSDWQRRLNEYLSLTSTLSETTTILAVAQAQQPQNLTEDVALAVPIGQEWKGIKIPPPREVKCVLLERVRRFADGAETVRTQEMILVGYHTDLMWHQGWVVHRPKSGESPEVLGCGLTPTPTGPSD